MNPDIAQQIIDTLHARIDELIAERDRLLYEVDAIPAIKAERDELTCELARAQHHYDHYLEQWSEVCNDNQILSNTCDESLAFIKELTKERDEWKNTAIQRGIDYIEMLNERDALKASNDSYITLANTAYAITEQRTSERDALMAAGRLALYALTEYADVFENATDPETPAHDAIEALKKAGVK